MREPQLIIATGTKGVGKTYTTCSVIQEYLTPNIKLKKPARKVLIFDVNGEYTNEELIKNKFRFRTQTLALKDLEAWSKQKRIEVRRILPVDADGNEVGIEKYPEILKAILHFYRGGMLILEDINKYLIETRDASIVGALTTNRHKDLDIYKKIDKFIGNENFDRNDSILTFGSIASFKTYDNDFLKASGTKYGFSQATIFSRSSRNNLLSQFNIKGYSVGQPDQSYLSQLDNKFTYKYPLIVQTFPETENFDNWFFELPPVLAKLGRLHFKIFFKILNLHIKPDGWHFMYFMDSDIGRIIIKLIILLIILFFYNKTTIKLPLINI
jgi:hypothetical protein